VRRKLVLTILVALFGGLAFFIARRHLGHAGATPGETETTAGQQTANDPTPPGSGPRESSSESDGDAASTGATAQGAVPDAGALADVQAEQLDRTLRVATTGWELVAPGVVANGGKTTTDESLYPEDLSTRYQRVDGAAGIRSALAVGGGQKDGADIGVVPLPTFVAAYEKFRALRPEVFFVTGWSDGREGLASPDEDDLNDPTDPDAIRLRGVPGSPSTYMALSILEMTGIPPGAAEIRAEFDDETPDYAAVARDVDELNNAPDGMELRVSTAEATRLVPFVAIASEGFLRQHPDAVRQWVTGWLEGRKQLQRDVPGAARMLANADNSVETVEMVDLLGWVDYVGLRQNAEVAGLSGRGAATLERLFQLSWRLWRESGVLSTPAPASLPVSTETLMSLISQRGGVEPPRTEEADTAGSADNDIFMTYRYKRELDRNTFVKDLGLVAGVFSRSHCTVSVRRNPELAATLIEDAHTRFGLDKARLSADDGVRWPGRASIDVHRP
jgi:ABC-type nitrate/sulfonate/bicarbonate transport system substrate-binding protein